MARSIDASFESTATVEQVHSAFCDKDYWLARIESFGGGIRLDSFALGADGSVSVTSTQDLRHEALPGPLAKVYPGNLSIFRRETWTPSGEREVSGDVEVTASGAPLSGSGTALLTASEAGSRLTFTGNVIFKLPVVGGRIESYLAGQLVEGLGDIQRFTTTWIDEHS